MFKLLKEKAVCIIKLCLFIIILIVTLPDLLYSQDLIKTYKDFLPQKYITDQYYSKQLSTLLENKCTLHPDLVYHYIKLYTLLNNIHSEQDRAECLEFKSYVYYLENTLLEKRNLWIKRQLALLDTMEMEDAIRNTINDEFSKLKSKVSFATGFTAKVNKINHNMLNYFTILFYYGDTYPKYSAEINYQNIRDSIEINYREEILKLYGRTYITSSKSEIFTLFLNKWYLFDSSLTKSNSDIIKNEPISILVSTLNKKYNITDQPQFIFGVGYSPFNETFYFKPSIYIKGRGDNIDIEENCNSQQFSTSIGYRYNIKNILSSFSYINVQLIVSFNKSIKPFSRDKGYNQGARVGGTDHTDILTFKKFLITPKSAQSYLLKVSTPLLVIFDSYNIELGLQAGINQVIYQLEYEYTFIRKEGYWTGGFWNPYYYTRVLASGSDKKNIQNKDNEFVFFPTIDFSYSITQNLASNISVYYKYVSVNLYYGF